MNQNNNTYHKPPIFIREIINDKENNIAYRRGKKLGEGGFGEVYEFSIEGSKEKRAIKIISKSRINDPQSKTAFEYEKKFNELLDFKYLCKCHNIIEDEQNTYFILDYMPNQTLNELTKKRKLTELEIKHYCFELLLALEYLHKMNIIHRDIKLSNVLLNENMEVRLCDFGLDIENGFKEQKSICGTFNYIAPELFNKRGGIKYSFKTDIWAFGILMYSLFYNKTPFKKEPDKKFDYNFNNIDAVFPSDISISKEAKDLLKKILVKDPDYRIKIEGIKASSFFRNGKGIPKYLPESTLDKALNRYEEENFINKAITRGECLDKDCNLPDIVANSKSYNYKYSYSNYTDQNEMESNISNIEHDDSSLKDDEDDSDENKNISNKNKTNVKQKENEHTFEVKIFDKNKPRNSISFQNINIIVEKNVSREETNKNIKVLSNEKLNERKDSEKMSEKNSDHFSPQFTVKEEKEDSDTLENKLSPKFKQKTNTKEIEKLDIINEENNEKIEIKKYNNNKQFIISKEKFENDKNNFNDMNNKGKILKENIINVNLSKRTNDNNNIVIKKFIDLSNKCGVGYILTNDDIGVCFNDGTKMIKIKNTMNFFYINEKGNQIIFNIKKIKLQPEQKTKVNALLLFAKEFNKNTKAKNTFSLNSKLNKQTPDLIVKKWIKSQYAYFFLLSNDKLQIIFEDKSQLFFDFFQKKICFINKMKENIEINIENNKFTNEEMEHKVKYAKRILKKMA